LSDVDTQVIPGQSMRFGDPPRWVDRLFVGLMIYSITGTVWMLTGFGGPQVTHYVGLLSDAPATLASVIIAAATVRYTARGVLRTGWILLAVALAHPVRSEEHTSELESLAYPVC